MPTGIHAAKVQKMDTTLRAQNRSKILRSYKLIKDLSTGTKSGNPQGVLDGDLDKLLGPRWRRGG